MVIRLHKSGSSHSSDLAIPRELELPVQLVLEVCRHAGSHDLVEVARRNLTREGITIAVRRRDSAAIYGWLLKAVSFQGISDYVAANYMEKNGSVSYAEVENALAVAGSCWKLTEFTSFVDCRFEKAKQSCSNLAGIPCCPVPMLPLRNGRLSQTAISLYLFTRDIAQGDFVGWIDSNASFGPPQWAAMRLSSALGAVFGISHKVAALGLSGLLLACSSFRPRWGEVGARFVVVDTLLHNFLGRTGLLKHLGLEHSYGPACYLPNGCADVLHRVASYIDAKQFNATYPSNFPRFIQQAIWRFCAELELDFCNGRRIDDRLGCRQAHCAVFDLCSREPLKESK